MYGPRDRFSPGFVRRHVFHALFYYCERIPVYSPLALFPPQGTYFFLLQLKIGQSTLLAAAVAGLLLLLSGVEGESFSWRPINERLKLLPHQVSIV